MCIFLLSGRLSRGVLPRSAEQGRDESSSSGPEDGEFQFVTQADPDSAANRRSRRVSCRQICSAPCTSLVGVAALPGPRWAGGRRGRAAPRPRQSSSSSERSSRLPLTMSSAPPPAVQSVAEAAPPPPRVLSQSERARLARQTAPRPWAYFCQYCSKVVVLVGDERLAIRRHLWTLHTLKFECEICSRSCISLAEAAVCAHKHRALAAEVQPGEVSKLTLCVLSAFCLNYARLFRDGP